MHGASELPGTFGDITGFESIAATRTTDLRLSASAVSGLARLGVLLVEDLRDRRPFDILEAPGVDEVTVSELINELRRLSTPEPCTGSGVGDGPPKRPDEGHYIPAPWESDAPAEPVSPPSEETHDHDHVLSDLQRLAAWRAGNRPERTLGELYLLRREEGMPPEVAAAAERLAGMELRDLGGAQLTTYDPVARFAAEVAKLNDRESEILQRRSGDDPDTLEAIGEAFELTRERIRQIERKTRERLSAQLTGDPSVADRLPALASAVSPILRPELRDQLLRRTFPGLANCDEAVGRVFSDLVLDQLPRLRSWRGEWLAVVELCEELDGLRRTGRDGGRLTLAELRLRTRHTDRSEVTLDELLQALGLEERDGIVRGSPRSLNDRAEVILAEAGQPLGFDELIARFTSDVNPRSLRNALFQDDRFVRTDRDAFALASWDTDEYDGILAMITRYLERQGGQASQGDIVDDLCGRFSIAESSVRAYASSAHFVQPSPGEVRIRRPGEPVTEELRPLSACKACVRIDDRWALRVEVTEPLLAGFSPWVPESFAAQLGVQPLQASSLPTELGHHVSVVRKGLRPSMGGLRSVAEELGLGPGSLLFVIAPRRPGAPVQFLSHTQDEVASATDAEATAMELNLEPPVTPGALAAALGLDEGSDPEEALARLRARNEGQLADRLAPFVRHTERADAATASDVARLLGI